MGYHEDAQRFIKSAKAQGRKVTAEGSEIIASAKATPTSHHTIASSMNGGGIARAVKAGAFLAAQAGKAFGKAIVGRDDFTQQVARQARKK